MTKKNLMYKELVIEYIVINNQKAELHPNTKGKICAVNKFDDGYSIIFGNDAGQMVLGITDDVYKELSEKGSACKYGTVTENYREINLYSVR